MNWGIKAGESKGEGGGEGGVGGYNIGVAGEGGGVLGKSGVEEYTLAMAANSSGVLTRAGYPPTTGYLIALMPCNLGMCLPLYAILVLAEE